MVSVCCSILLYSLEGIDVYLGPEIMTEAVRVLETVSAASPDVELKLESYDFGGCSVDKHGIPMTDETLQACQQADAILLGTLSQTTFKFTLPT